MTQFDTIDDIELQVVTGGWDWGRTGRAASDGAGFVFSGLVGAGRRTAGTPGAIAGGLLGAFASPVLGPVGAANSVSYDATRQRAGQSEFRLDNAELRAGR
ncbi:MAG TPA: hypothetical protein VIV11_12520 [Kofleriaceae bacterium]